MALREILRVETDKDSLMKLNNYKKQDSAVSKEDLKRSADNVVNEEQPEIKLIKVQ